MFTGNRGIIHDPQTRTLLNRRWAGQAWLICTLQWRGVRRTVMGIGSWTELFFLDEATALAAGHRPCFLCQRVLAVAFQSGFPSYDQATRPNAPDIDRVLHVERLDGRRKRLHDLTSPATDLPDGAMILQDGAPHLILNGLARRWSLRGYGAPATPTRRSPADHPAIYRRGAEGRLSPSPGSTQCLAASAFGPRCLRAPARV